MPRRLRGFTLIEMLLVMAVIAIVTAVTVPNFVRSIRGNRLRVAMRTMVMAGRYARSMAVMRQVNMAVDVNIADAEIVIRQVGTRPPAAAEEPADDYALSISAGNGSVTMGGAGAGDGEAPGAPAVADDVELTRKLDRVRIQSVRIQGEESDRTDGVCRLVYRNNGTCTPYAVTLIDENDVEVTIEVDALASATTELAEE
jgi:type II secretion system protein H